MDKESADQAVITPAYNWDGTSAALNTTILTLLPDIAAGLPGIIRLGTGALGSFAGNKGGKYLDDKLVTSFLQGIGSFAGGLAGYGFGNKAYNAYSLTKPLKLRTNYTGFTPRKNFSINTEKSKIITSEPYIRMARDGRGNEAINYYYEGFPNSYVQVIKDTEPGNYSVHFKSKKGDFTHDQIQQLVNQIVNDLPNGANLATWGTVSKGGFSGLYRFQRAGMIHSGIYRKLGFKDPKIAQDMAKKIWTYFKFR